eukprot:14249434-Ditylum_brightwellii.AAC.1
MDQFNTRKVGTPECITKIHPKIHNMMKLRGLIEEGMKLVDCNKEETVIKWKESTSKEAKKTAITDPNQLARIKAKKENLLPTFGMYNGSKKWGLNHNRVKAYVVNIQCATEDAPYMKTLSSAAYKQKLISLGLFMPQGLFRMAGEGVYKYQLRSHN